MKEYTGRFERIRSLEIDFDKDILKINREDIKDRPVVVALPGPEGWMLRKLFNPELEISGPEKCDRINVSYEPASSSKPL